MTITVEPLTGDDLRRALPDLARLRIAVFREWPYLYEGTLAYEQDYMAKFGAAQGAVIVAARDGATVVGAATATPMLGHSDAFAAPFRAHGHDVARIFYFGESVLLKAYRGRGIGHKFFDHREAHARSFGTYTHATFCSVVRPDDHPLKPADAQTHDAFWTKRGYAKADGVVAHFDWLELGESEKTTKPMQFWIRAL